MPSFNKSFTSVYLAVAYASLTSVVPSPLSPDPSTHRVRHISRDLKIESYHPPSSFEVRSSFPLRTITKGSRCWRRRTLERASPSLPLSAHLLVVLTILPLLSSKAVSVLIAALLAIRVGTLRPRKSSRMSDKPMCVHLPSASASSYQLTLLLAYRKESLSSMLLPTLPGEKTTKLFLSAPPSSSQVRNVVFHIYPMSETGGGTGTCLQRTEARGMGEGWSDATAEYVFDTCFLRSYIDSLIRWSEQNYRLRYGRLRHEQ